MKVIKNGLRTPDEYQQMFHFEIDEQGTNLYELLTSCDRLLETSVRSGREEFLVEYNYCRILFV
jgi:hypothetical protein